MQGLVYLDTSQLAWLDAASEAARGEFFAQWNGLGCTLALSFHHAQEVAQLADVASFDRRLGIIKRFQKLAFSFRGSASLTEIEIRAALRSLLGNPPLRGELSQLVFPPSDSATFAATVREARAAFGKLRKTTEAAAQVDDQMRDLRRGLFGDREPKKFKNQPFAGIKVFDLFPPLSQVRAVIRGTVGAPESPGQGFRNAREALLEDFGLDGIPAVGKTPDADLSRLSYFFFQAREQTIEIGRESGRAQGPLLEVVRRLDPYACPGFSLMLALRRQRLMSEGPAEPGHRVDEDHLGYAPYVEMAFVDKETLHLVRQARLQHPELIPADALGRLTSSPNLPDVLHAIERARTPMA